MMPRLSARKKEILARIAAERQRVVLLECRKQEAKREYNSDRISEATVFKTMVELNAKIEESRRIIDNLVDELSNV